MVLLGKNNILTNNIINNNLVYTTINKEEKNLYG